MKLARLALMSAALTGSGHGLANETPETNAIQALVGATVVDVSRAGRSASDIADAVVLIERGRILAVGRRGRVRIPAGARVVDVQGRYLIPGLIDGFGALRSQRFASAYLYEGVTTVYVAEPSPDGSIDGETKLVSVDYGPSILTGSAIGGYSPSGEAPPAHRWMQHRQEDRRLGAATLVAAVDAAADAGRRGITVGLDMWPTQLVTVVREAHRRGMTVSAEVAYSRYEDAVSAGVDILLRNDRYQLSLAGASAWATYRDDPVGGGGRDAMRAICGTEDVRAATSRFGRRLGRSRTWLMPALVLEATADEVGGPNPWSLPAAAFVEPRDLDDPVNPVSGARAYLASHPERASAIRACARQKQLNDGALHASGARFLAGTLTPSFGIVPGSGLHVEMQLLQRVGLSPREALATATGNFADLPGWGDRGRLERGRRADIVVLSRDPTKDVSAVDSIAAVIIAGRMLDRPSLLASRRVRS